MTWLLRRATDADVPAIMAIEDATFPEDAWSERAMRREVADPNACYLVAVHPERGGAVDGYAGLLAPRGSGDADVQTVAVADTARRRGLGRALMLALLAEADRRGAERVFLEVRADNDGAQHLYRSLGFEQIAVRKRYYPGGMDALVMRRDAVPPGTTQATDSPESGLPR
ncbi:MAG: rimI [Naasia sp.]|jgi:ribosomal-protein-alanine N-acetyltransferase|uniref:ribosomal protein S18-alanine N-acetyltransferase n=1 Tax=Naasia sp. TaxID=2546198 RepID=UPI0026312ACE|nr:ribosomal protein S18-alanine N-acetyltransferase [Naasia sp.]MCU1569636.1 rimI [Naasia sp.]